MLLTSIGEWVGVLEGWREGDVALSPATESSPVAHHAHQLISLQQIVQAQLLDQATSLYACINPICQ